MDTTESREQTAQSCEVHEESTSPTHEEASSNQQRKGKRKKHMNKPLTEQVCFSRIISHTDTACIQFRHNDEATSSLLFLGKTLT